MPVRPGLKATTAIVLLILSSGGRAATGQGADSSRSDAPPLRRELKSLRADGFNLVFSNALVKRQYRLTVDVDRSAAPQDQAAAMLAPFGLVLKHASPDVWYVVRAMPPPADDAPPPRARAARQEAPAIEEVVVSSSRYRLVRDTHSRRRLDSRELEVTPSVGRDLLRAVNQLPGQASVGVSARSHMRGGNTNEVLYLVDGVQIIEPFHMVDFHSLFSTISPTLVDSINVYHAGFPAAFGSRLSGVVDMEITQPVEPFEGRVNLDFINASTQVQGLHGSADWLISARRSTVDYLLDYVEKDYGKPKFHDELARVSWEGDRTDVTLGVLYGNDELALNDGSAGERARADYHNLTSWLKVGRSVGRSMDLELMGSFTSIDNEREGRLEDPIDAVGRLHESREITVASVHGGMRWQPASNWLLHMGVEGQYQSADFDVDIQSSYGLLGDALQPTAMLSRDVAAERDGTLLTAFVSLQNRIGERFTAEYGLRLDLQDNDPVHDRQFSPRLQITYDDGDAWHAYVNVGRYAQHQNLYELQLDDGLLELNEPQLADQVSVGVDWRVSAAWRVRWEAYWRRVDDPWSRFENLYNRWVLLPELHADRVFLNPDDARTFGGEMVADYRPTDDLRVSISLALARAEERLGGEWRPRPWEQRRTLRGSLMWRPGRWRVGMTAAYHTGWPTTSLVTQPMTGLDHLYDGELPDYFSLDIHTARHFELPNSTLEIYFDLSNATFAEHVGGYRYELRPTGIRRGDRLLLPAIPVLGLTWAW